MDNSTLPQKPDLFSATQQGDGSRRILASLESSGQPNAPDARLARLQPGHLVALLTLLAVVAAGVASFSYLGLAPARYNQTPAPAVSLAPAIAPQEVERRAAAIVNEPLPAIAPFRHKQATAASRPDSQAAPKAAPPAAHLVAGPVSRPAAHSAGQAERSTQARPRYQMRQAMAAAPSRASAAAAPPDSDVALLAALVAHGGGQPSAILHTRDVVERRDGDSTESLLRRCQRLGGAEAGLCRARICNGQWLHEAACRTPVND